MADPGQANERILTIEQLATLLTKDEGTTLALLHEGFLGGLETQNGWIVPEERLRRAYHESGHAIVAHRLGRRILRITLNVSEHEKGACEYEGSMPVPPGVELDPFDFARMYRNSPELWASTLRRGIEGLKDQPQHAVQGFLGELTHYLEDEAVASAAGYAGTYWLTNNLPFSRVGTIEDGIRISQIRDTLATVCGWDPKRSAEFIPWCTQKAYAIVDGSSQGLREVARLLLRDGEVSGDRFREVAALD